MFTSQFKVTHSIFWASQVVLVVKNPGLPMQEVRVPSLGQEDPWEEGMTTLSNILAWGIPWIEKPGEIQSTALQRVGHDWSD